MTVHLAEGPDWHLLRNIPAEPLYDIPDWDKASYEYAFVTDEPEWTREAVKAGWHRVLRQISRTWADTGLPTAMFVRRRR